jgi:hypothetical protein
MIAFSRRPLGRRAVTAAALVLLAAFGSTTIGCGSSEPEAGSNREGTAAQRPPLPPAAAGDDAQSASSGPRGEQRTDRGRTQSRLAGQPPAGGDSGPGPHTPTQTGAHPESATARARALCPPPLTRADCATRVRAQKGAGDAPSYPVSSPSDCAEVMSEAECKEIISAQKAAVEAGGGRSIDPRTCLQEYTREFCEAQLGSQYEQQQRAASQAGQ